MDWTAALQEPPFSDLEEDLRDWATEALNDLGDAADVEAVTDVLAPFLIDRELAADEDEARGLCTRLAPLQCQGPTIVCAVTSKASQACATRKVPMRPMDALEERQIGAEAPIDDIVEIAAEAGIAKSGHAKKHARVAAHLRELRPNDALELSDKESPQTAKAVALVLQAARPWHVDELGDPCSSACLAEMFLAYVAEQQPSRFSQWTSVLLEAMADAGAHLDDEDNDGAAGKLLQDLYKKRVLVIPEPQIELGSNVVAVLEEDGDWHPAVVEELLLDSSCRLIFLEYGKPQITPTSNIRAMEVVIDDDGAEDALSQRDGNCEMCGRYMPLTFHHLIPKDTHPTYLKKRLPTGIEGEPTRAFLNTYGTMICRQCHSYVHRIADNHTLAKEYNTVGKIMAHAMVQKWVEWASKQQVGKRHSK